MQNHAHPPRWRRRLTWTAIVFVYVAIALLALVSEIEDWGASQYTSFGVLALLGGGLMFNQTRMVEQIERGLAAERTVRESEANYRLLADNATDIIFVLDQQLARRYVSPASLEILGYGAEELIGTIPLQMTHPDDIDGSDKLYTKLFAGELDQAEMIKRVRHRDGRWIWVELTLRLVRDRRTREPIEIHGTLRDISRRIAAETAQREAEGNFRLLADHVGDVVVRSDLDAVWRYVSPSATQVFGVAHTELIGHGAVDFVHPGDRPAMLERLRKLRAGIPEKQRPLFRILRPDGIVIWIEAATHLLFDPVTDGPAGHVSVLRDVTARVAKEAAARQRDETYRLLLQSTVVHEAVYMIDVDGAIESWNVGAERIYGYTESEIVGRNYACFFTPEDVATGAPSRQLQLGRENGSFDSELVRQRRDGSRFLAHVTMSAIRRDDGSLRGFALMVRDMTTQKVEQEQREIISEAAPNAMMIVDENDRITLANAAIERMFCYGRSALLGKPLSLLLSDGLNSPAADAASQGREIKGRRRDGSEIDLEILLSPVETATGRIRIVSLFDLSERKRHEHEQLDLERSERQRTEEMNVKLDRLSRHLAEARNRAEQASHAKSRFLSGMSHELRTPLNGILGYARLLQMEGGLSARQGERVDAMLAAGRHLLEMITRVLDLSEIESGRITLKPGRVHLETMALASLDLLRPAADAKALALDLTIDPKAAPAIVADPTRLRQVLLNLLGNAVKFTDAGSITLRLRQAAFGAAVRIEIADTGRGIPDGKRSHLFQEFERFGDDDDRATEGAGLGLALSNRLAVAMGGSLGFHANDPVGSVFWLELPVQASGQGETPTPEPAERDHGRARVGETKALRILIVDDVAMNRDVAASFLVRAGHAVTCVGDGMAALDAVAADKFDVVLMDVQMPEIDGLETTRRIRALPAPHGLVPIVAVTAQAFADQLAACRAAGMTAQVTKPFDPETLIGTVERVAAEEVEASHPKDALPAPPPHPVFNQVRFSQTSEILEVQAVWRYLDATEALCRELAADLKGGLAADLTDGIAADACGLAEKAHRLAGSAGMFGFDRLAHYGRKLEHALQTRSSQTTALGDAMARAIDATIAEIQRLKTPDPNEPVSTLSL